MRFLRYFLLTLITTLVIFAVAFQQKLSSVLASSLTPLRIAEYINHERLAKGITPLSLNSKLAKAAYLKGKDMLDKDYWAHFGPNNESPWQFILKAGYDYVYAGENLAKGFSDAYDIVAAWMASPSHRENVLEPEFKDVGIAVLNGKLQGEKVYLIVALFGSTLAKYPLKHKSSPALAIVTPLNGAILKDGIVDVRAKAINLDPRLVNLYVNDAFVGRLKEDKNGKFATRISLPAGKHNLSVRAMGDGNVPLLDFVKIVVENTNKREEQLRLYKSNIRVKIQNDVLNIDTNSILSFAAMYVQVDNISYRISKLPYQIELPALESGNINLHFVVELADGSRLKFDKLVKVNKPTVLAGRIGFIDLTSPYSMIFAVLSIMFFGVSLFVLILALHGKHYLIWDVLVADLLYIFILELLNVGFVKI